MVSVIPVACMNATGIFLISPVKKQLHFGASGDKYFVLAQVVELVDTQASGACTRKGVLVRV